MSEDSRPTATIEHSAIATSAASARQPDFVERFLFRLNAMPLAAAYAMVREDARARLCAVGFRFSGSRPQ